MAKDSHDKKKQASSPQVQQMKAESDWLSKPVDPWGRYCRVLEFDVIHARIREIRADIGEKKLNQYFKYELYKKTCFGPGHRPPLEGYLICRYNTRNIRRDKPYRDAYEEFKNAHGGSAFLAAQEIGLIDLMEGNVDLFHDWPPPLDDEIMQGYMRKELALLRNISETTVDLAPEEIQMCRDMASRLAQSDWYMENCPEFYKGHYSYREWLSEVARKTAADNGYVPSCVDKMHSRPEGYVQYYNGKIGIPGVSGANINWEYGIPDQDERDRLIALDKTGRW